MTEYWFARYRPGPVGQAGRGISPLSWKGAATIAAFVMCMIGGGLLMIFFGLRDQMLIGVPAIVVLAAAGASFFIWASVVKTDPVKSITDYRKERGG
jgi:hypothetical protein